MPTVTVPGVRQGVPADYATITLQYQTQQNANIAIQLLSQIYAAAAGGTLTVKNDAETATPGPNPTTLSEFTIGDSGGLQNTGPTEGTVPTGYLGIADGYTNQAATITGAPGQVNETVVAGGGLTFLTNGGSGTVISGQGNNLVAGSGDWTVRFDGGNNTVFAGSGNFFIDDGSASTTGANLIFLGSGNDVVQSWGNDVIVAAPGGTALVATFTTGSVFFGNTGPSTYENLGGNDTFVAGGGNDTVFAEASGGTYFGNSGPLLFLSGLSTSNTVVTGSGNATLFGAPGSNGLYFLGSGTDVIVGAAESQSVIGGVGSGAAQIFGINGDNVTFFSPVSGNVLVAGPGNVTLNGGGATGNNAYFAGPSAGGADSIVAGSGNNTLVAGPGSNTLVGGAGADVFAVNKVFGGGGADSIVGWNSSDLVALSGYGAPTAPGGLPADATKAIVGGSQVLTLADGTKITFVGVAHIPNSHILSS
jgi:Ca2+-binding RTX toxin-like protein